MNKFTEAQLEAAIIELLGEQGYPHLTGEQIVRAPTEVLIKDDPAGCNLLEKLCIYLQCCVG